MTQDFYEILGISRDASEEQIEDAYREAIREYHPDVSDDPDAEEKFKTAKKAKEVLTDDEKRQLYDRLGHEQFLEAEKRGATDGDRAGAAGGRAGAGGMGGGPFGGGGAGGFEDVQDIFDQFFGGGRRGGNGSRPRSGQDLKTQLTIDLEDAYEGLEKQVTIPRPQECPECGGTGHPPEADARQCPECNGQGQQTQVRQTAFGRMQQTAACPRCEGEGTLYDQTCSTCGGNGVVREQDEITVDIPAGVKSGQTRRIKGKGAPGERGGPNGDLLVEISVRDHPEFERDGDDLQTRTAISFPQAVFGDTVEIDTLDGPVEFDVPAGTQSGETFRLRGKGMPRLRGRGHGDLYATVQVVTPESLSDEQREALEAFAEAGGEEIGVDQGFFERLRNSL